VSASAGEVGGALRRSERSEDTEALGKALAPALEPGDVIQLTGPLGAGKTRFVEGLARGLEARGRVRSPTFTLLHVYEGRIPLIHVDLYRLETPEVDALGLEEALERGALVAEWGEKLPGRLLAEALAIAIEPRGGDVRELVASAERGRGLALLAAWCGRRQEEPA
jgi:tRNA threonylcarbamoyladenosine biosynthesis protein TsaE